jgi:thiamine biosynthesis lipoprotein
MADLDWGHWGGEHVLGTSFDLEVRGGGDVAAAVAAQAALTEARRLDCVLSTWRADSEIALLHRQRTLRASPDLFALLSACATWRAQTRGAFDVVRGASPDADVRLDARSREATLAGDAWLDVDAIAKGYVIDRAFAVARRAAPQARALMLNLGGDMRAWAAPEAPPWRVAIADPARPFDNAAPLQTVALRTGALAASGAGHRNAQAPIRDPRTGRAVNTIALSAAMAQSAADADALATSLAVMDADESAALLARMPEAGGLLIGSDGAAQAIGAWRGQAAGMCQADWPEGRALTVSFEIPVHEGGNYERPYVAIWVTDEARNLVRTLLILGPQPRWRESNYIFWRRVERMDAARIAAVARPTRAPGRYDVAWDGRTDAGERAPLGRYTINIEASREHGGHSFVSVPIDLEAGAVNFSAEASQELGQTRIEYGSRS